MKINEMINKNMMSCVSFYSNWKNTTINSNKYVHCVQFKMENCEEQNLDLNLPKCLVFTLINCPNVKTISGVLTDCSIFTIDNCPNLEKLPDLPKCDILNLTDCPNITSFPDKINSIDGKIKMNFVEKQGTTKETFKLVDIEPKTNVAFHINYSKQSNPKKKQTTQGGNYYKNKATKYKFKYLNLKKEMSI